MLFIYIFLSKQASKQKTVIMFSGCLCSVCVAMHAITTNPFFSHQPPFNSRRVSKWCQLIVMSGFLSPVGVWRVDSPVVAASWIKRAMEQKQAKEKAYVPLLRIQSVAVGLLVADVPSSSSLLERPKIPDFALRRRAHTYSFIRSVVSNTIVRRKWLFDTHLLLRNYSQWRGLREGSTSKGPRVAN